jgi:hypothetical protein
MKNLPSRTGSKHSNISNSIQQRKNHSAYYWIFDSPKNNARISIEGDLPFMFAVLLEANTSIERYEFRTVTAIGKASKTMIVDKPVLKIVSTAGVEQWKTFSQDNYTGKRNSVFLHDEIYCYEERNSAVEVHHGVITPKEIKNKETLFENWLQLCAAINRCRGQSTVSASRIFTDCITNHPITTVENILSSSSADRAVMLAVLARCLQAGIVTANLETRLFGLKTKIHSNRHE